MASSNVVFPVPFGPMIAVMPRLSVISVSACCRKFTKRKRCSRIAYEPSSM
jgi:hypothetical protein